MIKGTLSPSLASDIFSRIGSNLSVVKSREVRYAKVYFLATVEVALWWN